MVFEAPNLVKPSITPALEKFVETGSFGKRLVTILKPRKVHTVFKSFSSSVFVVPDLGKFAENENLGKSSSSVF